MQYMLLIYDDEQAWANLPEDEFNALYAEYGAFTTELTETGSLVASGQLQPTTAATTVRSRKGDQLVTDGPFAETKEQLGGYYLIDVESMDEALEWAAKVPSARYGSIEVRPLVLRTAETPVG